LGLKATELAQAQVSTIRTKLLKIGAQIRVTVRKVWISMASSYPWQGVYRQSGESAAVKANASIKTSKTPELNHSLGSVRSTYVLGRIFRQRESV